MSKNKTKNSSGLWWALIKIYLNICLLTVKNLKLELSSFLSLFISRTEENQQFCPCVYVNNLNETDKYTLGIWGHKHCLTSIYSIYCHLVWSQYFIVFFFVGSVAMQSPVHLSKLSALHPSTATQWLMWPLHLSHFLPSLQAQAPTPPLASTWWHLPPGPTCPGRRAMTEASSRHSQSGMAMCESSQHALLSAFSSYNTSSVVSEIVFPKVVFRTVVKT